MQYEWTENEYGKLNEKKLRNQKVASQTQFQSWECFEHKQKWGIKLLEGSNHSRQGYICKNTYLLLITFSKNGILNRGFTEFSNTIRER